MNKRNRVGVYGWRLLWIVPFLVLSLRSNLCFAENIVVFVHGVGSSGVAANGEYSYPHSNAWVKANIKNVSTIDFDWSEGAPDHPLHASIRVGHRADQIHGMSDRAWAGAAKLKELVARIRSLPGGAKTSITIIAHSQGTVLTLCALQEGMQVENVVFMGSPLFQHIIADGADETSLARASENVTNWFVNLCSPNDTVVDTLLPNLRPLTKSGCIGSRGLPHTIKRLPDPGVKEDRYTEWKLKNGSTLTCLKMTEVEHNGDKGWWRFHWLDVENRKMWPESMPPEKFIKHLELADAVDNALDLTKIKEFAVSSEFLDKTKFGFGSGREFDQAEWTFTLTKGMSTGFHFDDKRVLDFSIEVLDGEIDRSILHATWFTWEESHGLPSKRIDGTKGTVAEAFESRNFTFDATLWLRLEGVSETARVKVIANARMHRGNALPKVW